SFFGNINDEKLLTQQLNSFSPEIVFHLAAQPLVGYSYLNPIETIETNVLGTTKVFEACRSCDSVKAIVCVTSDKVYRNHEQQVTFREEDELGGADPYSVSKSCAELIAYAYRKSFFSNEGKKNILLATARAGNVIG